MVGLIILAVSIVASLLWLYKGGFLYIKKDKEINKKRG